MEVSKIKADYSAPTDVKIKTLIGTSIASGLCIANMMKRQKVRKIHQIEMGIREGIELCSASSLGGLFTGLLIDKKETHKYKLKDGVNQLVGNTFIPFGALVITNMLSKPLPKLARTLAGIVTLIGGTFLGHNIANKVNKKVFKEDSNYECTVKDFIGDMDDYVLAASTVLHNKKLYEFTATVCPATFLIHGYLSGTRQQDKKLDIQV